MTEQPIPTDIYAEAFFTADHGAVESGKLYVNGGFWNRLNFPSYPQVHTFTVCAVIHIPWRAHHQGHTFAIYFEDADGQITPNRLEGKFQIGTAPDMRSGDATEFPIAAVVATSSFNGPATTPLYCRWTVRKSNAGDSALFR